MPQLTQLSDRFLPARYLQSFGVVRYFLLVDAALILVHIVARFLDAIDVVDPAHLWLFRIDRERGFGESWLYLKWAACAALLATAWRQGRIPLYAGFAVVFVVLFLDDSLSLHEKGGNMLAETLGLPTILAVPPNALGELLTWAALGTIVVTAMTLGYRRTRPEDRGLAPMLFGIFAALLVFAIGVDLLHVVAVKLSPAGYAAAAADSVFGLIEDGGEMICGSLAAAVAWAAARERTSPSVVESPAPRASAAQAVNAP